MSKRRNSFSIYNEDKLFCLTEQIRQYMCLVDFHFPYSWRHRTFLICLFSMSPRRTFQVQTTQFSETTFTVHVISTFGVTSVP